MKKILTEVRPSSGQDSHTHDLQVLEGGTKEPGMVMVVCRKENCSYSKLVKQGKLEETKEGKTLLLG